jgi:hypothetical protein
MTEIVTSALPTAMRDSGDPIPQMMPPEGVRQMKLWRGDEFTFSDLLDFVNPLHHIPIISTIYAHLTGESPGALARLTVGGLIGGPLGLLSAVVNTALITETGKDAGQIAVASLFGDDTGASNPVSDEPRALMALASDRGEDYAYDRTLQAAGTGNPAVVVAYNAGDPMPGGTRPYGGMSDRGSEANWDRIQSTGVATAAGPMAAPGPSVTNQIAPVLSRNSAPKTAPIDANPLAAAPQSAMRPPARRGPSQGPQISAQQMAAQLSANQGVSPRSAVSNALRQDPAQRVPGRPLGVALPATSASPFSSSMMDALEKYEALAKSRNESAPKVDVSN